jgi:hypothetical protein
MKAWQRLVSLGMVALFSLWNFRVEEGVNGAFFSGAIFGNGLSYFDYIGRFLKSVPATIEMGQSTEVGRVILQKPFSVIGLFAFFSILMVFGTSLTMEIYQKITRQYNKGMTIK